MGSGALDPAAGAGVTLPQYCQQLERRNQQLQQQLSLKDTVVHALQEELKSARAAAAAPAGMSATKSAALVRRLKTTVEQLNIKTAKLASKNLQLHNANAELRCLLEDRHDTAGAGDGEGGEGNGDENKSRRAAAATCTAPAADVLLTDLGPADEEHGDEDDDDDARTRDAAVGAAAGATAVAAEAMEAMEAEEKFAAAARKQSTTTDSGNSSKPAHNNNNDTNGVDAVAMDVGGDMVQESNA